MRGQNSRDYLRSTWEHRTRQSPHRSPYLHQQGTETLAYAYETASMPVRYVNIPEPPPHGEGKGPEK